MKRIAYILSMFPALPETFVMNEVIRQRRLLDVQTYSLRFPGVNDVQNDITRELSRNTEYGGFWLAPSLLRAALLTLLRRPLTCLKILILTVIHHAAAPMVLIKCCVILPKVLYYAERIRCSGASRIHCHFGTYPAYAAWVVHQLHGIPYSFTVHAHDIYDHQRMLRRKVDAAVGVVVNSEYNREFLLRELPGLDPGKLHLIRTGIDLSHFLREIPSEYPTPDPNRELRVLAVGRVDPTKGYQDMIRVIHELRKRGYRVRGDVIGHVTNEPYIRSEMERLLALVESTGLNKAFAFHERLPFDELKEYYRKADLFLLPCVTTESGNSDGLPSVLVEAMATGVPVVSTRISGIPELVVHDRTGLITREGDVQDLANQCERILTEEGLAECLAREGQRHVLEHWDLGRTTEQMYKFLEQS
jgi:colanic acid/amylovoran biosynthesis glycosyltransferase